MTLSLATGLLIAIVGAVVASVKLTGALEPALAAASVSWATMLWLPLPDNVMLVLQVPSLPTVAVPICVVTPFTVSNSLTVVPGAASPAAAATLPLIVCVACSTVAPSVLTVTVGGMGF